MKVICPKCKSLMVLRETQKYKYRNGANRLFYGCSRWPECDGIRPSHPNGQTYGVPADEETKQWRIKAHEVFDKLWKNYGYTRPESYKLLQMMMNMNKDQAHISNFSIDDCKKLISKIDLR